jgi:hypothetical protein
MFLPRQEEQMRLGFTLAFALLIGFALNAQQPRCAPCPDSDEHSILPDHVVCLSSSEMASYIVNSKPVGPPGLNEPHVSIDGIVVACLLFAPSGKEADLHILSGPAIAFQAMLDSVKDWTFRPVKLGGRRYGGCGTLRIRYVLNDGQLRATFEQ